MIYEPREAFGLLRVLNFLQQFFGGAAVRAGTAALGDWAEDRAFKPWQFYAGVFAGNVAVLATGQPLAASTMYVAGDILEAQILHSPESSELRIFLDGVQQSSIVTYAATEIWETIQLVVDSAPPPTGQPRATHRVDFVHVGAAPNNTVPGSTGWSAIGPVAVTGAGAQILNGEPLARAFVTFKDDKGQTSRVSVWLGTPPGGQTFSALYEQVGHLVDAMTISSCAITGCTVSFKFPLPNWARSIPDPTSDVEEIIRVRSRVYDRQTGAVTSEVHTLEIPGWPTRQADYDSFIYDVEEPFFDALAAANIVTARGDRADGNAGPGDDAVKVFKRSRTS